MTVTSDDLVRREVYYCVSSLVATLAKDVSDTGLRDLQSLCEQADELCFPLDDYESAAEEAGWSVVHHHGAGWRAVRNEAATDDDVTDYTNSAEQAWQDACNVEEIEPHSREVFEHWLVSDWLADKLEAKGEKVDRDFAGLNIWARTTTGQAVAQDWVIEQITQDRNAA